MYYEYNLTVENLGRSVRQV